jgi:hypothetical protein
MSNVFASNAPDPSVAATTAENAKRSRGGHAAPDFASTKAHGPTSLKQAVDKVGGPAPKVAIGKTEGGKAKTQIAVKKVGFAKAGVKASPKATA